MGSQASGQGRAAPRRAWIISIGTELTLGQCVDTNAGWLARELAGLGIRCERHVTVPDESSAIRDAFQQAATTSDLIVATGGLGPTDDDLTRAALAQAAGVELVTDADSVEQIRGFFTRRGREMPERNQVQALRPRTARAIANICGTAPGIRMEFNGTPCYVLPGVPSEMETMFRASVAPELGVATAGRVLRHRALRCFGLHEAGIGERLRDLMAAGRNPTVGTTAELGVISVRINADGETEQAAESLLDATEAEVCRRLGSVVFGRDADTLASVVGAKLAARGETLSTAESCTGGLIAKLLTDVPGSSAYFAGGAVTYANELKEKLLGVPSGLLSTVGAVSEPVVRAMARGAQDAFGSTYALAVTGIAGPAGGTAEKPVGLVFLGLATPAGVSACEMRFGSDSSRSVIRERAARTALNLLRARLSE